VKKISVTNQKGGVGKSTVCVHLAWRAAEQGIRTCVVDFDAQGNTSSTLAGNKLTPNACVTSQLFTESAIPEPLSVSENLDLIAADFKLNDVESFELKAITYPGNHLDKMQNKYDLIIFDTPPQNGRRLLAALSTSDYVISPLTMDKFALDGVTELQRTIKSIQKKVNPKIVNLGLLPNRIKHASSNQILKLSKLREALGDLVSPYYLVDRVAITDAIEKGNAVWVKARGGSARQAASEMTSVIDNILKRLGYERS